MVTSPEIDSVLRESAPAVLATLVRRYGDFESCEDAVQEALLAASRSWSSTGLPENPTGWLVTVGSRRRIDAWRSDDARLRREQEAAEDPERQAPASVVTSDDTLTLFFLCCHPCLPSVSQVALTLRAVGGLTTPEIGRALHVPEATVAQRISRAKQKIKASDARFVMPPEGERTERLAAVAGVLYLIFNEGHTASAGVGLHRVDLTAEATRLARELLRRAPDDGEVAGLLALMLLTDARRPARTTPEGALIPLEEQNRQLWDSHAASEGIALLTRALQTTRAGPFQLQAAIAAVHAEAPSLAETDWPQILGLYDLLIGVAPSPMARLSRCVAVAMNRGPLAGLAELDALVSDPTLHGHYRVDAVRAHLYELAGDHDLAARNFRAAAQRTLSLPERAYLRRRAGTATSAHREKSPVRVNETPTRLT